MQSISGSFTCLDPQSTFDLGERLGADLRGGDAVLLEGGLGAGKTLFTKGIMQALGYDVDEVTSPSFTLVNLYRCENIDAFHIDLWRIDERADAAAAVGLDEILDVPSAVVIIEWPSRLGDYQFPGRVFEVSIAGDGDDPRTVSIKALKSVGNRI